ncbi:hypothetical protein [Dokdonella sp.]|uniref:hypothetical protein n=1 Tax=Dokdonella sp. TaxID=2291710 RepID=UPI0031C8B354|nr:hypothetical protein [Dokdonella sp.]
MNFRNLLRVALLAIGLAVLAAPALAADVKDGNAIVDPQRNDRFAIDGFVMGKAELYGYMGDLRDTEKLTGIVLKSGGTDAQRQVIISIAGALGLKAFERDGNQLQPLGDAAEAPPTR